ncbi:MAG TPA: aldehyde dehydrogenase family protein [Phycisphaerae bacterium]|nr:aldehyde dehydrogenase family protein [Phycisphaerae bacterium]
MPGLTDQQVDAIARRALERLGPGAGRAAPAVGGGPAPSVPGRLGVFPDVDSAVRAAAAAHRQLMGMTLAKREEMVASIRRSMKANAEALAEEALQETGLGRYDDKIEKNRLVAEKTPGTEDLVPLARTGDRGLMLTEPAPYGVIAAITPVTNPTSTIICNTIGMVAAGNAVVFNVHPAAKKVSVHNVSLINKAITDVGGPANLVAAVGEPTIESAQALMRHPGIRLVVVTGGPGVVKEAMASGKRAICAGPGNPPVVVDETADLDQAGRDIVIGASFDNNVICVDEKTIIAVKSIADNLIQSMVRHGAVLLTPAQARQLERLMLTGVKGPRQSATVEKSLIGQDAGAILSRIGMNVDHRVRLGLIQVDANHPLVWTEQMMPIMPVVRVSNADEGIDLAVEAELGRRHTAVMHSRNLDNLSRMARVCDCSIFVKNGPAVSGLGWHGEGYTSFSIASPTGEGLTKARDFTRERRCTLVDHFRIT